MQGLLLGAGASFDCGLPLVWELTAELKRWLKPSKIAEINEVRRVHGSAWDDAIVETLASRLADPAMHYENVIGAIEVDFSEERDPHRRQVLHGVHAFLLQAVHGLLMERQVRNLAFMQGALRSYVGIGTLAARNRPLWVFTLNHDVVIDVLATSLDLPIRTGFHGEETLVIGSPTLEKVALRVGRLTRNDLKEGHYDFFRTGEYGINLVKMHGALDIFAAGDQVDYLKILADPRRPTLIAEQIDSLRKADLAIGTKDGVRAVNEHMYLDEVGEVQFLRNSLLSGAHKFAPGMTQIAPPEFLALFRERLDDLTQLTCIGYSFSDGHIDRAIATWLDASAVRALDIVNPGMDRVPSSLAAMASRTTMHKQSAAEYFVSIADRPESWVDAFLRRLRASRRARLLTELFGPS